MTEFLVFHGNAAARNAAWEACDPRTLQAYVAQYHDTVNGASPDELDWIYIGAMPLAVFGEWARWYGWWQQQKVEAASNGMQSTWEPRLDPHQIIRPVVVSFHGGIQGKPEWFSFSIWDGNDLLAASLLRGCTELPAVVGVLKGLDVSDLPPTIRQAVERRRDIVAAARQS